ncbi:MAG: hypothetical protein ABIL44_07795 [candidate division WOR-3 bacterium]
MTTLRLFSLLIPFFLFGTITFEKTYGIPNMNEIGYRVINTTDSGYAAIGIAGTGRDMIYFLRVDSLGNLQCTTSVSQGYVNKSAYSFIQLPNGGFASVGDIDSILDLFPSQIYIVWFNANGDTVRSKVFGGDSLDIGYWIEITPDSNLIITGETKSYGSGCSDVWLVKMDFMGNIIWTKTFGGESYDIGRCVKTTPDNGFIIVGSTYSLGNGFSDIYLIKTDSLGNLLWQNTYGGSNYEYGYDVEVLANGYIIVGQTNSFDGHWDQDVYLIRTDSLGDTVWTKTFDNNMDDDVGYSIAITSDNGFVIAGYTTPEVAGYMELWLIKTDTAGNLLWTRTYGGQDDDCAYGIEKTDDNGYIITGYTCDTLFYRSLYLIKTDSLCNVYGIGEKTFVKVNQREGLKISSSLVREFLNIEYSLKKEGWVELSVYGATGSTAKVIKKGELSPGDYQEKIYLGSLASGVYFVVLKQNNENVSKKFLLIK